MVVESRGRSLEAVHQLGDDDVGDGGISVIRPTIWPTGIATVDGSA